MMADKGKRGRPEKFVQTGANDEMVDRFFQRFQSLKDELDEHKAPKKELKDEAEAAGVNVPALEAVMKLQKWSDAKRSNFVRCFNRYCRVRGITWSGDLEGDNRMPESSAGMHVVAGEVDESRIATA